MRRCVIVVLLLLLAGSVPAGWVADLAAVSGTQGVVTSADLFLSHSYFVRPGKILPIDWAPGSRYCYLGFPTLTVSWMIEGREEIYTATGGPGGREWAARAEIEVPLFESTLKIWGLGTAQCTWGPEEYVLPPTYIKVVDPKPMSGWYHQVTDGDADLASLAIARTGMGWALPFDSLCGWVRTLDGGLSWFRNGECPAPHPGRNPTTVQAIGFAVAEDGSGWYSWVKATGSCDWPVYETGLYRLGDSYNSAQWVGGAIVPGAMVLIDETTGFALADEYRYSCQGGYDTYESGIYRLTTNGIWERVATAPCYRCEIFAVDSRNVWLLEQGSMPHTGDALVSRVWRSTDGGTTWSAHISPEMSGLRTIVFLDPVHGWVAGDGGIILATNDGGQTWTSQQSSTTTTLNAVRFVDAQFGWAVGDKGTILATTDGGRNWHQQPSPLDVDLHAVYFRDRWFGWIAGDKGVIMRTCTGGESGPTDTLASLRDNKPVVLDGYLNEWEGYPQVGLDAATADRIRGVLSSVSGDSSAVVYSAWSDEYLYLAARVRDDVLVLDSEDSLDDDALELALDGLHDHRAGNPDDHTLVVRYDGMLSDTGDPDGYPRAVGATRVLSDGWSAEVAVPWAMLTHPPMTYTTLGLTIGLHDDDDGGDEDAFLIWRGWSTTDSGYNGSLDGTWGHLWLVGDTSIRQRLFLPTISVHSGPP